VRKVEIVASFDRAAASARTIVNDESWPPLRRATRAFVYLVVAGSHLAISHQAIAGSRFDGMWNLTFVTQRGACDPIYNFTVDVLNGSITHPNILTFKGRVAQSGAVRAAVRVGQRYASGSGRLSGVSGQGVWSGYSDVSRCAGTWTARRN
jgi:hypothetical protein